MVSSGRRILIVEDNADAREALRVLLELDGHTVEAAAEGLKAIEIASAKVPDIALVDIGLPGLDGYGVARELRKLSGRRSVLIALTGYGQPDDQERTRAAGFDQHLVKPVNPKLLSRLLQDEAAAAGR